MVGSWFAPSLHSSDFIDLCHSPLSYLLSSLRHLVWLNSSLPVSHLYHCCQWCHCIMHHYIFLISFLFLTKLLVIFADLCFYYCEALSWHFYRTFYYNLEILFLSGISQLGASHSLYKVRIVFFFLTLLHICLYWISFSILLHSIVKSCCNSPWSAFRFTSVNDLNLVTSIFMIIYEYDKSYQLEYMFSTETPLVTSLFCEN